MKGRSEIKKGLGVRVGEKAGKGKVEGGRKREGGGERQKEEGGR